MRKFLLLLLLALTTRAFAQDKQIQNLQQQISNHPQQDSFLVNRLNDWGDITSVHPQQKDSIASVALAIAKKINYPHGIMYAMVNLSYAKSGLGDNRQAMDLAQQAYTMAEKNDDKEMQARVLLRIAGIKSSTAESATAIHYLLKAEAIAENLPDKKFLADYQAKIGSVYLAGLSNFPKAMEWALKSVHTSEAINCQPCLANSWRILGDLYNNLGDHEKSLSFLKRAQQINDSLGISNFGLLNGIGENYRLSGKYPEALEAYQKALVIDKTVSNTELSQSNIADVYVRMNDLPNAFNYGFTALSGAQKINDLGGVAWIDNILARAYLKKNFVDSALYYATKGLDAAKQSSYLEFLRDNTETLADAYSQKKDFQKAYDYHLQFINYRDSMSNTEVSNRTAILQYSYDTEKTQAQINALNLQQKNQRNFLIAALAVLALIITAAILLLRNNRQKQKANKLLQQQKKEIDTKANELARQKADVESLEEIGKKITSSLSVEKIIGTAYNNVNTLMDANIFGIGIYNDALKRIEFPATYEEGKPLPFYTNAIADTNRFAVICFEEQKEIIMGNLGEEHKNYIQQVPTPHEGQQAVSLIYLPLIAKEKKLGVITVQSFQQNAYSNYHLYMLRNIAIYTAIALDNAEAYEELKSAQAQLIQSEKMASLGELTAGIAHEIQNPLNFVNNFSEINKELISELVDEVDKGNAEDVKQIAGNIKENSEKINFHGKRADAIVKGMLQHSRSSTGQKEPTDINVLCDEYLRLAYHGLRAKDKSFNANFKTEFDNTIEKVNIVPQEIGRVILNLINNAFYAVSEKKKTAGDGYGPTVIVSTKKENAHPDDPVGRGKVLISVSDNGNGIPEKIKDKIFQPFFTTKPTGQGTGLGLSLSYDIIKAHGGAIKIVTAEGKGSEFIIQIQ